ncbi:hypothetical protein RT43_GL001566 [Enterococcus italicus DSM 15952]|nr:hypothetical protein RT43_GL001566 [Enterococcus italicus DSM 15952]
MEASTKKENDITYEVHHNFMDIQIDIIGSEKILIGNNDYKTVSFNDETDFGVCEASLAQSIALKVNTFLMIFPYEAHKPTLINEKEKTIKKLVCKVKMT